MTRQIDDLIRLDDEQRLLWGWPLEGYWRVKRKRRFDFPRFSTNCHRGYRAVWLVVEAQLYLVSVLNGHESWVDTEGKTHVAMFVDDIITNVFPRNDTPVPAHWVSGEFYTVTEDKTKAEMLTFSKGVLVSRRSCEPFDPHLEYRKRMSEMLAEISESH